MATEVTLDEPERPMMLEATTTSDNSSSYGRKFIDGWGLLIIAIPILILDVLLTKYILDEAEILPPFLLASLQLAFSALTLTVFKWIRQSPESSPASMRKIMKMEAGDGSASPTSYSAVAVGLCLGFSMAASHGALLHLPVSFLQCLTTLLPFIIAAPMSSLSKKEAFASSSTSHRKSLFFFGMTLLGVYVFCSQQHNIEMVGVMAFAFSVGFGTMYTPWLESVASSMKGHNSREKMEEMSFVTIIAGLATFLISVATESGLTIIKTLFKSSTLLIIFGSMLLFVGKLALSLKLAYKPLPSTHLSIQTTQMIALFFLTQRDLQSPAPLFSIVAFSVSITASTTFALHSIPIPSNLREKLSSSLPRFSKPRRTLFLLITFFLLILLTFQTFKSPPQPKRNTYVVTADRKTSTYSLLGVNLSVRGLGTPRPSSRTLHAVISSTDGNIEDLRSYIGRIRTSASEYLQPYSNPRSPRAILRITVLIPIQNISTSLPNFLSTGADEIHQVPTERLVGSRAVLRYLVTHYNNLDKWTAFMGKPDDAVADVDGFFRSVKEDTAFGVVDGAYNVCGCKSPCVDESGGVLVQIWALAYRTFCPESGISVQTSKNFVVSSKRVRSLPLKTYKYLYTYTAISDYQVIPKDSKLITTSEVIDMSWPVIFRCAHSRMAETCHMGGKCSCSDGEA